MTIINITERTELETATHLATELALSIGAGRKSNN